MSRWPGSELPRTEGTRKLKRREIREWVIGWQRRPRRPRGGDTARDAVVALRRRPHGQWRATIDELGLSSLERVELMVALEERFHTTIDESPSRERRASPTSNGSCSEGGASQRGGRRHARAGGLPVVEPVLAGAPAAPREPGDLAPPAGARLCVDPGRRTRAPRPPQRSGRLRREPSEPHGRAGDPRGDGWSRAGARRGGHGQGVLRSTLLPGARVSLAVVHATA